MHNFPVEINKILEDEATVFVGWGRPLTYLAHNTGESVEQTTYYGAFELYHEPSDYHCEGGLWYQYQNGKDNPPTLLDYDGVYELPKAVKAILKEFHFEVDDCF